MARNQLEARRLFQLEEVRGQALSLAYYEAYGDYREADRSLARIRSLTARDLRRLAREYLDPDRATLFAYIPNGTVARDDMTLIRSELAQAREIATKRPPRPTPPVPAKGRKIAAPRAGRSQGPRLTALPDGGALIVQEDTQLPTLSVGVYFPIGRCYERVERAGLTRLGMRAARTGGAGPRDPDAFLAAVDSLGASLTPELDSEYVGYRMHLPSARSGAGLELLADLLVAPAFSADRLDRERESIIADIRQAQDQPGRTAIDLMLRAFFGERHPLGSPSSGREEVVAQVSRDEVVAWHRAAFSKSDRLVVAAGNAEAPALEAAIESRLARLPARAEPRETSARAVSHGVVELIEPREKQQTALAFGFAGPTPVDPDYPALLILLETLSGFGGRLAAELRGRQSLAYTVSAYELGLARDNLIVCFIAGEAAKEGASREGMIAELEKLHTGYISDEELNRARAALLGRRATGLQTLGARVSRYAWVHMKGVGLEGFAAMPGALARMTVENVRRVAQRYLTLDRYVLGISRGRGK